MSNKTETTKYDPQACISFLKGKIKDLKPNDCNNGVAKSIEVYTDTIKHLGGFMSETITTKPQKFRVNFKWAKIERANYEVFAANEEQAQAIAQELFRENYTPDCRIEEFTTIETVTAK